MEKERSRKDSSLAEREATSTGEQCDKFPKHRRLLPLQGGGHRDGPAETSYRGSVIPARLRIRLTELSKKPNGPTKLKSHSGKIISASCITNK